MAVEAGESPFNLDEIIKKVHADELTEGGIIPLIPTPPDEFLVFGSRTILALAYAAPRLTLGYTIKPDHT